MAEVQQANQALAQHKVVLTELAGRWVTVNALSQAENGEWIMGWSHSDFPEAHIDKISDAIDFIIRDEYASYRRPPGRPPELQGEYELVSVKVRKDLLAKIKASGKSRREYIEELLEK